MKTCRTSFTTSSESDTLIGDRIGFSVDSQGNYNEEFLEGKANQALDNIIVGGTVGGLLAGVAKGIKFAWNASAKKVLEHGDEAAIKQGFVPVS